MRGLGDLLFSAIGAGAAWGIYEVFGQAAWALAFLLLYTALYLWLSSRQGPGDDA